MTAEVIFLPAARAELIAAQDWYERSAPGLGARFRVKLMRRSNASAQTRCNSRSNSATFDEAGFVAFRMDCFFGYCRKRSTCWLVSTRAATRLFGAIERDSKNGRPNVGNGARPTAPFPDRAGLLVLTQGAQGQFADHEGVRQNPPGVEQAGEPVVARAKTVGPDGGVDQDHAEVGAVVAAPVPGPVRFRQAGEVTGTATGPGRGGGAQQTF